MSGVTVAGEMAGTLAYMPPEQLKNFRDVKPQSDIYAVGMTAYSLLSGSLALNVGRSTSMAETIKAIFDQPTIPLAQRAPHLPSRVCEVIDPRCEDQTPTLASGQACAPPSAAVN